MAQDTDGLEITCPQCQSDDLNCDIEQPIYKADRQIGAIGFMTCNTCRYAWLHREIFNKKDKQHHE